MLLSNRSLVTQAQLVIKKIIKLQRIEQKKANNNLSGGEDLRLFEKIKCKQNLKN